MERTIMFPTTQHSATNLATALTESKVAQTTSAGSKAFLKFDFKSGDFCFGREAEDITGQKIVINTYSITHGWVMWVNGSPKKEMVAFNESLPAAPAPVAGNEASEGRGFEARFLGEESAETILSFESNSYGGRQGVDSLLSEIKSRAMSGEQNFLFPVVQLTSSSYKSKQGSTIHNPKFMIVDWLDLNGESETGATSEPQEEEAPTVRRRKA